MKFKFDCIFYYVHDLDISIPFYTEILGFKLDSRNMVARLFIDDVLFELVPATDTSKMTGSGNARLCLEVAEIHKAINVLQEKGVPVGDVQDVGQGKLVQIEDPDGNEIVLWQYT